MSSDPVVRSVSEFWATWAPHGWTAVAVLVALWCLRSVWDKWQHAQWRKEQARLYEDERIVANMRAARLAKLEQTDEEKAAAELARKERLQALAVQRRERERARARERPTTPAPSSANVPTARRWGAERRAPRGGGGG
jgi:hypothetical protein